MPVVDGRHTRLDVVENFRDHKARHSHADHQAWRRTPQIVAQGERSRAPAQDGTPAAPAPGPSRRAKPSQDSRLAARVLQAAGFFEAVVAAVADDDVIEHRDAEHLASSSEAPREFDIVGRRRAAARRVIVGRHNRGGVRQQGPTRR